MDGHGQSGGRVSKFVAENLGRHSEEAWASSDPEVCRWVVPPFVSSRLICTGDWACVGWDVDARGHHCPPELLLDCKASGMRGPGTELRAR